MEILYYPIVIGVILFAWIEYRDVLNPILINACVWVVYPLLHAFVNVGNLFYKPLSDTTYAYLLLYVLVFSLLSFLWIGKGGQKRGKQKYRLVHSDEKHFAGLILLCIAANLGLIFRLMIFAGTSSISATIAESKFFDLYPADIKFLIVLFNFSFVLLCYIFLYKIKVTKLVVMLLLEVLLVSFLLSAKGRLIRIMFLIAFIGYSRMKKKSLVRLLPIFTLGVIGIYMLTMVRDQAFFSANSLHDYSYIYMFSPLDALDSLLKGTYSYTSTGLGARVFGFFYRVGERFLGTTPPVYTEPGFVSILTKNGPVSTNVFTLLGSYYMDFGYWGSVVCGAIWAFIFGYPYRKMRNMHSPVFTVFYLINIPYLIFQFFGDFIMPTLSITIQELICTVIIYWIYSHYQLYLNSLPMRRDSIPDKI